LTHIEDVKPEASPAVAEHLAVLDDAAFGAASEVKPKFIAPVDPAARWTVVQRGVAKPISTPSI
jgi:hypothetical protein